MYFCHVETIETFTIEEQVFLKFNFEFGLEKNAAQ